MKTPLKADASDLARYDRKLSKHAVHLLKCLHNGQNRLFVMDARPPGWLQIERLGLVVRVEGYQHAQLTKLGENVALRLMSKEP